MPLDDPSSQIPSTMKQNRKHENPKIEYGRRPSESSKINFHKTQRKPTSNQHNALV